MHHYNTSCQDKMERLSVCNHLNILLLVLFQKLKKKKGKDVMMSLIFVFTFNPWGWSEPGWESQSAARGRQGGLKPGGVVLPSPPWEDLGVSVLCNSWPVIISHMLFTRTCFPFSFHSVTADWWLEAGCRIALCQMPMSASLLDLSCGPVIHPWWGLKPLVSRV